jgi:hypothetical protein
MHARARQKEAHAQTSQNIVTKRLLYVCIIQFDREFVWIGEVAVRHRKGARTAQRLEAKEPARQTVEDAGDGYGRKEASIGRTSKMAMDSSAAQGAVYIG